MNAKIPLTLVCSAALAFACGPRARNDAAAATRNDAARVARVDESTPLAPALDVTVDRAVHFSFQVVNHGKKRLEVSFPDGRTHDVVVLDTLGREVWRWSEGRMFTQAMQNRVLRTSDLLLYEEEWETPTPGKYVAVATLASRNFPVERRVEFVVPQM